MDYYNKYAITVCYFYGVFDQWKIIVEPYNLKNERKFLFTLFITYITSECLMH